MNLDLYVIPVALILCGLVAFGCAAWIKWRDKDDE